MSLEHGRAGRARRIALICTAAGLASMIVAPLARPATPPPPSPRPVTVVLHGLCGQPESACAPFVEGATARGWLVCPRGEDPCGSGARWRLRPSEDGRLVEDAVSALSRAHDGQVQGGGRVLVGFSLGGIAAVRIAESGGDGDRGTYTGLVVIASQVHPDAARLVRAGVRRVVLAAGDYDITSAPLREDARALAAASGGGALEVRFVSLGKFGHGYPPDMQERMREPMAWVSASAP